MKNFTYEIVDNQEQYETYEWDNTWIDHANDFTAKRVLYIGDSISCKTRHIATEQTNGELLFDGYGTSKGIDNPYFKDSIRIFANQQKRREAVIFNNGLHGWHLKDETEYRYHYEEMIKFLLDEFQDVPVFIALTTHIADKEREERVICRNQVAKDLANKYQLPVIDLYSVSVKRNELLSIDGVHLVQEGYEQLAKESNVCISDDSCIDGCDDDPDNCVGRKSVYSER